MQAGNEKFSRAVIWRIYKVVIITEGKSGSGGARSATNFIPRAAGPALAHVEGRREEEEEGGRGRGSE